MGMACMQDLVICISYFLSATDIGRLYRHLVICALLTAQGREQSHAACLNPRCFGGGGDATNCVTTKAPMQPVPDGSASGSSALIIQ